MVVAGTLILATTSGCADENFTQDIEANWCELVGAECAPPPPPQAPLLNPPTDAYRPSVPVYSIPPIYTPPARSGDVP